MAEGPSHEVAKFSSYKIDGVQFYTKTLDDVRACQNSGVYLVADTMQVASARDKKPVDVDMSFYGVINEIWELNYTQFRLPSLSTSVDQIFYVQDPLDPRWSVVLRVPARDYNDLTHSDELGDTIIDNQPLTDKMPSVEAEEVEVSCMRADNEDILVNED
ncbi:hypothetical protein M0R45_000312 [Rubus argutus]|uniref:DUF4216 domain-containing protein n=1 Tax=Rubus argutus TaxID=59490 RepID=A0AAW1VPN0_RUBAR